MKWSSVMVIVLISIFFGGVFCLSHFCLTNRQQEVGATFSSSYSLGLNLEPRQVYLALLEDLGVKKFRIPVYWSEIEPDRGVFQWDFLDFVVQEAEKHQAKLTMVIGRKVPRWPECDIPDWAEGLVGKDAEEVLLKMEKEVIERYKDEASIERWQIENEPFFPFGICPSPDINLLKKEISLVKSLDERPIVLTVSGEWDPWRPSAELADVLGVSLYRVSWNKVFGFLPFPLSPYVYQLRTWWVQPLVSRVIVSELQAEPWFTKNWDELSGQERAAAFTADDLKKNFIFAKQAGFSEIYLWGVEWWYREKLDGRPELWEDGRKLF